MKKFAIYIRVSTQRQGQSGLGLESQVQICEDFIRQHEGELVRMFKDVESGTHRDRKGLADAVQYCKQNDCALVIAKLDRLARDVEFCFKIVNTGIEIHFCDMPSVNTLLLGVFASVAQYERELISERTKRALAAKKARGEKTGGGSERWQEVYYSKTKEELEEQHMKRGLTKNERHLQSRDVQAFIKVLKKTFPESCNNENAALWDWEQINTKGDNKERILSYMKDFKEMDETGKLFVKWDFDGRMSYLQVRLASTIHNLKQALTYKQRAAKLERTYVHCS